MIEARYASERTVPGCGRLCPCRAPKAFGWAVNVFSTGAWRRVVEIRPNVFAQVPVEVVLGA